MSATSWISKPVGILVCCSMVMRVLPAAAAQDSRNFLDTAKALYASAAYEEALVALGRPSAGAFHVESARYRVLCLIALGRVTEAEGIIGEIVMAEPFYIPDRMETTPRVQESYARARRRLVPEIASRLYGEGKAALASKDRVVAMARFGDVISLIDSAGPDVATSLDELKMLAEGFLELSRAQLVAERAAAPGRPITETPGEALGPRPVGEVEATQRRTSVDIVRAVPLKQEMPPWVPDTLGQRWEFTGSLRVTINAQGTVDGVVLVESVHPAYDRPLLRAARSWTYQPALADGKPVPSEQIVQVRLRSAHDRLPASGR